MSIQRQISHILKVVPSGVMFGNSIYLWN